MIKNKLMCNLADMVGNRFEQECEEHLEKLDKAIKYCKDNCLSKDECVDHIYISELWLGSRAELAKCFE